jgi:hypothetical protein
MEGIALGMGSFDGAPSVISVMNEDRLWTTPYPEAYDRNLARTLYTAMF